MLIGEKDTVYEDTVTINLVYKVIININYVVTIGNYNIRIALINYQPPPNPPVNL